MMQQLPKATVQLITSCQVITSPFTIVKELIENSLDAGATKVDVKLVDFGLEKIEVHDNGIGVEKKDIRNLCSPNYTSKICNVDDLLELRTYGFRGEALHSICVVANVTVTTKTNKDDVGSTYKFQLSGTLDEETVKPAAGCNGTTVIVNDLFANIPVRLQYYSNKRSKAKELKKIEWLLMAYSIACPDVRFSLHHNQNVIFTKNGFPDVRSVLRHIWGNSCFNQIKYLSKTDLLYEISVDSFLPSILFETNLEKAHYNPEKSFIIINRRPVFDQDIERLLKEKFNSFGQSRPFCYCIMASVPPSQLDVNLEPNKTRVFCHQKETIMSILKTFLEEMCTASIQETDKIQEQIISRETGEQNVSVTGKECPKQNSSSEIPVVNGVRTIARPNCASQKEHQTLLSFRNVGSDRASLGSSLQRSVSMLPSSNPPQNIIQDREKTDKVYESRVIAHTSRKMDQFSSNDWSRGSVRSTTNEILKPVQLLIPNEKHGLSPVKDRSKIKKKCLSSTESVTYAIKGNNIVKLPFSPYMMFARAVRQKVISENPTFNFSEIEKIIAQKWEMLDSNEMKKYEELCTKKQKNLIGKKITSGNGQGARVKDCAKKDYAVRVVNVNFNMMELKERLAGKCSKRKFITEVQTIHHPHLIGKLTCGAWLVFYNDTIGLWNHFRAKELELFHNLLENHKVQSKLLDVPLPLNESLLGNEQWLRLNTLQSCPASNIENAVSFYQLITDQNLVYNGVQIRKWDDPNTNYTHAEITHLADCLPYYGSNDVKEILSKISKQDGVLTLTESRPLKLINYFKSEAVRLVRQLPIHLPANEINASISQAQESFSDFTKQKCFHGGGVFSPVYDLKAVLDD